MHKLGRLFAGVLYGLLALHLPASAVPETLSKYEAWLNSPTNDTAYFIYPPSGTVTRDVKDPSSLPHVSLGGGGGVTSIAGTANQIDASSPTGAVTLSLDPSLIFPGTASWLKSGATHKYTISADDDPASNISILLRNPGASSVMLGFCDVTGLNDGDVAWWKRNAPFQGGYLTTSGGAVNNYQIYHNGTQPVWKQQGYGVNYSHAPTDTVNGSTSGKAYFTMPDQGTVYKKVLLTLESFNDIGHTFIFPTAFAQPPCIVANTTGLVLTVTNNDVSVPATGGAASGTILLEGF